MFKAIISNGYYRANRIVGEFELVKTWQPGAKGGFVTVRVPEPVQLPFTQPVVRITCREEDVSIVNSNGEALQFSVGQVGAVAAPQQYKIAAPISTQASSTGSYMSLHNNTQSIEQKFLNEESKEDAKKRVRRSFEIIEELTQAAATGIIRGLIISGPPGIGKSFGVEEQLVKEWKKSGDPEFENRFNIVKGSGSAIGLYQLLYNYRSAGKVIVFDDADDFLWDETSLNLLKGALDGGKRRRISWIKESRVLKEADIPNAFDFEASCIFLTNLKFDKIRSPKIEKHLQAMQSRCHYLDLEINSDRDIMLRIEQVIEDGMLDRYDFTKLEKQEVIDFIFDNQEYLTELSLRIVNKVADFRASSDNWEEFCVETCLKRSSKYKRLAMLKEKAEAKAKAELAELLNGEMLYSEGSEEGAKEGADVNEDVIDPDLAELIDIE